MKLDLDKVRRLPSKTLAKWIEAHQDRVADVDYGDGYTTESENAYDVLLAPGWRCGDDWVHTIIEETATETLSKLREIVRCDCDDCKKELAA